MTTLDEHDCSRDGCLRGDTLFCIYCGLTVADWYEDEDATACFREFGAHDHDPVECARLLADMSGEPGYYATYNLITGQWDTIY